MGREQPEPNKLNTLAMERSGKEQIKMTTLKMATEIKGVALSKIAAKTGTLEAFNETYVILDDAYLENNKFGGAAYFANAVKINDEIDEEGYAPLYQVEWKITNSEAEDGSDACDWDEAEDIEKVAAIDLETGTMC